MAGGHRPTPSVLAPHWLLRPVAGSAWDHVLWLSGGVALTGVMAMVVAPGLGDLAVFFALSLLINGPYGMFLPTVYEPVVMIFARLHSPWLIACLGAGAATIVEYVNYRLFHAALHSRLAHPVREARVARAVLRWFALQPFLTIVVCAIVPIPFWTARSAAALVSYPVARHLAASALGRFLRLVLYGYLATSVRVSSGALLALGLGITAVLVVLMLVRARRHPGAVAPSRAFELSM
jgi:uncharacterized membrane protein YdjX (TVP38/TMEM64 family)